MPSAQPSIPGAHTLAQYDPLEFSGRVEAPGVDTPRVDGPWIFDVPSIHTPRPYGEHASPLQAWRQQVEAGGSGDSVDSPLLRNTLGYLTVEMQVQHLGASGTNYIHLVLSWA